MGNVPRLRFGEFDGEYIKMALGEFADVSKLAGFEFTNYVTYSDSGEIIALRGLNIKNNSLDLNDVKFIDGSNFSKLNRSKLFVDDIMFTYIGTIGEVALIEENDKYYLAPNVSRIRVADRNQVLPRFVLQFFNNSNFRNSIKAYVSSSSQPALTMENVRKFEFLLPSFSEQSKIASFLTSIDDKLSQLKKKKALLEEYKKGMMQKIFSREVRFKDRYEKDFDDWKEVKLDDFNDLIHGDGDWILSKDITPKGEFKIIQLGNIGMGQFVMKDLKTLSADKFIELKGTRIQKGDLLINRMVDSNLYCCLFEESGDFITSVDVCWIRKSAKINNYFLMSLLLLDLNQVKLLNLSSGSGRVRISKQNLFQKFFFEFPSLPEQTKIAQFLSALDDKINLVSRQITQTEGFKKGLLQQMFV